MKQDHVPGAAGSPSASLAPAVWTGVLFALAAPTVLPTLLLLILSPVEIVLEAMNPWSRFGPRVVALAPLYGLFARTSDDWFMRGAPAIICAFAWWLANFRRPSLASGWRLALFVLAIAFLLVLFLSPLLLALEFPRTRQLLAFGMKTAATGVVEFDFSRFSIGLMLILTFFGRSYGWIWSSNAQTAGWLLLTLTAATWTVGWLVHRYARARSLLWFANTLQSFWRDIVAAGKWGLHNVKRLAALAAAKADRPGDIVARAVARPWLFPALCALLFLVLNGGFSLYPAGLLLSAAVAYAITRGIWRLGVHIGAVRHPIGGATVGLVAALVCTTFCATIANQAWVLQVSNGRSYSILVSALPGFVAMIVSLYAGASNGAVVARRRLTPNSAL